MVKRIDFEFVVKYMPYVIYFALFIICINHSFFQDTIQLSSKHATWYYNNNFRYLLLPQGIDSGHPPLNGMMLALLWKIFGRSLWVGHTFMAMWGFIMIYQLQKLSSYLFSSKLAPYVSLVVLLDATLLTQFSLVSPDVILISMFITALSAMFSQKKYLLMVSILFVSLISTRGMMCTAALYFCYLFFNYKKQNIKSFKDVIKLSVPFLPGVLLALAFLGYHYYVLGWVGYHPDMPWAACFEKVNFMGFFKNVVLMVWRFIDFGRIIIWLLLIYSLFLLYKNRKNKEVISFSIEQKTLMLLFVLIFLISSYSFLFHVLLSGHRYLLPLYLLVALIVFVVLDKTCSFKKIRIFAYISMLVLLGGNFVKYPEKVATGWDSTLAHLPYYGLRTEMFDYIEQENISFNNIASGFGMSGNQNDIDLSSPTDWIIKTKASEADYYLYSNVMNDPDELIDILHNPEKYTLIKKLQKGNVFLSLYKKLE